MNQTTDQATWPRNQPEPVYVWSNNWTPPNDPGSYIGSQASVVRLGRDIIDNGNTPMPGYTPYTYPHPLTRGLPPPSRRRGTPQQIRNMMRIRKGGPGEGKSRKEKKQKGQRKPDE